MGCTTFFLLISQAKQQPKAEFQRRVSNCCLITTSQAWVKTAKELGSGEYPLTIFGQHKYKVCRQH